MMKLFFFRFIFLCFAFVLTVAFPPAPAPAADHLIVVDLVVAVVFTTQWSGVASVVVARLHASAIFWGKFRVFCVRVGMGGACVPIFLSNKTRSAQPPLDPLLTRLQSSLHFFEKSD